MYKEGFGFVVDDDEFARMAKLGIGMPVQQPVVQQPIQQQVAQEPVQEQQIQQVYEEPKVQMNDEEISASVDKYLKSVLGDNYATPEVKQEQVVPEVKQNDDFFSSWMSQDKVVPETKEEQKQVPVVQDSVLDYRKGIVEASIRMGKDPAMIERTIATITPEEYVIFAEAKARYEESLKHPVEQPKQQIVFNSLKPKPVASVAQASPAEFEQRTITQSSVIGNAIKNKFY